MGLLRSFCWIGMKRLLRVATVLVGLVAFAKSVWAWTAVPCLPEEPQTFCVFEGESCDAGSILVKFSSDGTLLLTVSDPPNNLIKVWDLYTGQLVQVFHAPAPWLSFGPEVVFSPDGKFVAAGIMMTPPPRGKAPTEPFPCIKVWDLQSGQELFSLSCQSSEWVWPTFDPSGRFLCICQWEASLITILSVTNWEIVETIPTASPCAEALYSPEGDLLLVNEGYVTLRVLDRKTYGGAPEIFADP